MLARVYQIPYAAILEPAGVNDSLGPPCAKQFLEQLWNEGDLSVIDTMFQSEFRFHHDSGVVHNREEMRQRVETFRRSFSDFDFLVEESDVFGEFIVCRWVVRMTQTGQWLDLAPTHHRVTVHGSSWVKVVDGKFGDAWDFWDAGRVYETLKAQQ